MSILYVDLSALTARAAGDLWRMTSRQKSSLTWTTSTQDYRVKMETSQYTTVRYREHQSIAGSFLYFSETDR